MFNNRIDSRLMEKYPNKYNLTPKNIKKLKILDWDRLMEKTWYNAAMLSGNWWCHLNGSGDSGAERYGDDTEFWIGFNRDNDKINCHFSSWGGMCGYDFKEFYDFKSIENDLDYMCQINAIQWLNMMIDEGILGL